MQLQTSEKARQVEHCLHSSEGERVYLISFCLEILAGLLQLVFLLLHRQNLSMHNDFIRKKKKRKDYASQCQFDEKPSNMPGCPGMILLDV